MKKGIWLAVGAYCCWGLFPLYWKLLHGIPAIQVIGHRIVWSFLIMLIIMFATHQWKTLRNTTFNMRMLVIYLLASFFVGINWLMYVWAVNTGNVVEASLGYYTGPMFSVSMGVIFFRERLRLWQWISIGLALTGVLYLTIAFGSLPWIALTLAFSWGLYGLVKKMGPLGSLHGLLLETGILFVPSVVFLVLTNKAGHGAFLHAGLKVDLLLVCAGLVTTLPLLMFASAAKRIPLSFIGILQFITPTIQFLLGILVYHEPFTNSQMIGYSFVWIAFALFCTEGYITYRKQTI